MFLFILVKSNVLENYSEINTFFYVSSNSERFRLNHKLKQKILK